MPSAMKGDHAAPATPPVGHGHSDRPWHRPITGYEGPRLTLLVVDDQPIQRQMLAGMLMPLGFQVREAAGGLECLESVRDACPDAVLLDVSMDDMDGWSTSRAIREAGFTDVPIIMVSANVFENRPENLAAAQCQAFVAKPVIESELLDTLGEHLHIDWTTELVGGHVALAPGRVAGSVSVLRVSPVPREAAAELSQLARMGHVQGVAEALTTWSAQRPEHDAHWQAFRRRIDDFDLDGLLADLAPALNEDPLDEPQS